MLLPTRHKATLDKITDQILESASSSRRSRSMGHNVQSRVQSSPKKTKLPNDPSVLPQSNTTGVAQPFQDRLRVRMASTIQNMEKGLQQQQQHGRRTSVGGGGVTTPSNRLSLIPTATSASLSTFQPKKAPAIEGTNLIQLQAEIQESAIGTITVRRKETREKSFQDLMSHLVEKYNGNCSISNALSNRTLYEPEEKSLLKLLRKETTTIDTIEEMRMHMTQKIMWLIQEHNNSVERADLAEEKYKLLLQSVLGMDQQRGHLQQKLFDLQQKHEETIAMHREIDLAQRNKSMNLEDENKRLKERFNQMRLKIQQADKERKSDQTAIATNQRLTALHEGGGGRMRRNSTMGSGGIDFSSFQTASSNAPEIDEKLSEELETQLAGLRPLKMLQEEFNSNAAEPLYRKCKELIEKIVDNEKVITRAMENERAFRAQLEEAGETIHRAQDSYERLQRIHEEDVKQHQTLLTHLRDKHVEQLRGLETRNTTLEAENIKLHSIQEDFKQRHKAVLARMRDLQELTLKSPSTTVLLQRLQSGDSSASVASELKATLDALVTFHNADASGLMRAGQVKAKVTMGTQTDVDWAKVAAAMKESTKRDKSGSVSSARSGGDAGKQDGTSPIATPRSPGLAEGNTNGKTIVISPRGGMSPRMSPRVSGDAAASRGASPPAGGLGKSASGVGRRLWNATITAENLRKLRLQKKDSALSSGAATAVKPSTKKKEHHHKSRKSTKTEKTSKQVETSSSSSSASSSSETEGESPVETTAPLGRSKKLSKDKKKEKKKKPSPKTIAIDDDNESGSSFSAPSEEDDPSQPQRNLSSLSGNVSRQASSKKSHRSLGKQNSGSSRGCSPTHSGGDVSPMDSIALSAAADGVPNLQLGGQHLGTSMGLNSARSAASGHSTRPSPSKKKKRFRHFGVQCEPTYDMNSYNDLLGDGQGSNELELSSNTFQELTSANPFQSGQIELVQLQLKKVTAVLEGERQANKKNKETVAKLEEERDTLKLDAEKTKQRTSDLERNVIDMTTKNHDLQERYYTLFTELTNQREAITAMSELNSKTFVSVEEELEQTKRELYHFKSGEAGKELARREQRVGEGLERIIRAEESIESVITCFHCLRLIEDAVVLVPCAHVCCFECFQEMNPHDTLIDPIKVAQTQGTWHKQQAKSRQSVGSPTFDKSSSVPFDSADSSATHASSRTFHCGECQKDSVTTYIRTPILDEIIDKQSFKAPMFTKLRSELRYKIVDTSSGGKILDDALDGECIGEE
eukprot:PhM_4_TR11696/c0_g1_i1/m.23597